MIVHRARLPIAALLLICLFAASAAIACTIGRAQPPPEILHELRLTDCALPCWLGITPGETIYEEATHRLVETFPGGVVIADSLGAFTLQIPYEKLAILVMVEGGFDRSSLVRRITIVTAFPEQLILGDLVGWHGKPVCFGKSTDRSGVIYRSAAVDAIIEEVSNVGIRWRSSVVTVEIEPRSERYGCDWFPTQQTASLS